MEQAMEDGIFILTGAGISAESGVPVFQGTDWRGHSHYDLANIDTWHADPELVWEYYSERRQRMLGARPNAAHGALAELQKTLGDEVMLCTQNVDSLHEEAGSVDVIHIHGRIFESRCADGCGCPPFADQASYSRGALPRCECGALVRPNVVWFGEEPKQLKRVYAFLDTCRMLIAIGTSGNVQPVASFVAMPGRQQIMKIYLGLDRPANAKHFGEVHLGPATEMVPKLVEKLIAGEPRQ
jgi:NAD-dependent protein deacetylase/lipoamidase